MNTIHILETFYIYNLELYISDIVIIFSLFSFYVMIYKGFFNYNFLKDFISYNLTLFSIILLICILFVLNVFGDKKYYFFNLNLYNDFFVSFIKFGVILMSLCIFYSLYFYSKREKLLFSFEVYSLILISILSMFLLISSTELIILYLSLELQSLIFYVLASSRQNSILSIEAGLKYFVLGTIASGFLLLGSSIIYGWTGLSRFNEINLFFFFLTDSIYIFFFIILFLIPFFFKFSVAPFHIWTPDVYEGSPTIITFFFSIVPKFVILGLLIRFFYDLFLLNFFDNNWKSLFFFCTILTLILGSLSGIFQIKIKRLLAYSSITNVGFFMSSIFNLNIEGFVSGLIYFIIYFVSTTGIFLLLIILRYYNNNLKLKNIYEFASLININFFIVFTLIISFFSLIGLPPLAGFFGKFFILFSVLNNSYFVLFFFLILASILSAFFYLRVIRLSLFKRFLGFCFLIPIPISITLFLVLILFFHCIIFFFFDTCFEYFFLMYHAAFNSSLNLSI